MCFFMRIQTSGTFLPQPPIVPVARVTSGPDPFSEEFRTDLGLDERRDAWSRLSQLPENTTDKNQNPGTTSDQELSVNPHDPQISARLDLRTTRAASPSQAVLEGLINSFY
jgi:hypothetical protein